MREKLLFLAKLSAVSIILFIFKDFVSAAYGFLLALLAKITLPIFQPGLAFELTGGKFIVVDISLIPLISLTLATPKIGALKRLKLIGAGLAIFLLIDLIIMWLGLPLQTDNSLFGQSNVIYTIYRTVLLILPLTLWLGVTFGQLKELFLPKEALGMEPARICPICNKQKTGLYQHVKDVHGKKALKKLAIKSPLI